MKKRNYSKIALVVAAGTSLLASTAALAQQTQTSSATMQVRNTFDLDEVTPLTFGTITALQTQDLTALDLGADDSINGTGINADVGLTVINTSAGTAGIRIKADGTANEAVVADQASLTFALTSDGSVDPGNDNSVTGDFSSSVREITAGTPGTYTIANAAPFTRLIVSDPVTSFLTRAGAPASESFILDINLDDMVVTGGGNPGSVVGTSQPQTDANGAVGLTVGGELRINPRHTDGVLTDGVYSGTYTIEVRY